MARVIRAAGDDLALLRAAPVHPGRDPVGAEQPHQVVFEREEEDRLARVALAAGAAAQLPVDAPGFVPLGADDLEPGLLGREVEVGAELDVGAAAGHVRRDRDGVALPRPGHDFRLPLVVLRVQHLVLEPPPLEHLAQRLGRLHGDRADQHRQPERVEPLDLVDDGVVLLPAALVDQVDLVVPPDRPVGRDDDDVEAVDRCRTRSLPSRRCRSCRTACRTSGSSSGW